MSRVVDGKFACDACGKRYGWKPEMAGRKAKCACGATVVVPQPEPADAGEADDLYDFAAPAPVTETVVRAAPVAVGGPAAAGVAPVAQTVAYRSAPTAKERDRFAFSEIVDAPRDLYVPTALLVAGFLGMIAWAVYAIDAGAFAVVAVSVVSLITTLVKTAVLIGASLVFAPRLGISFGELRTAILKFAAIIIFTDMALAWLDTIMVAMDAVPQTRRISWRVLVLKMLLVAGLISVLCHYLFQMDGEETGMFAIPFAILSGIVGFVLKLMAVVFLAALLEAGSAAPAPVPPTPPARAPAVAPATPSAPAAQAPEGAAAPPPAAAPAPVDVVTVRETEEDRQVAAIVKSDHPLVKEARAWNERAIGKNDEGFLAERLYAVGAVTVHVNLQGGRGLRPSRMYVQLPAERDRRAACVETIHAIARERRLPVDPASVVDASQRYRVLTFNRD